MCVFGLATERLALVRPALRELHDVHAKLRPPQDFVVGLDTTIGDAALSVSLRHRTLRLALVFACAVHPRSLNSYILRRGGLFGTLVQLLSDPATEQTAFDAAMLLSVLSNFGRFEQRNAFLQRLEDLVDDGIMATITAALSRVLIDTRQCVDAPSSR